MVVGTHPEGLRASVAEPTLYVKRRMAKTHEHEWGAMDSGRNENPSSVSQRGGGWCIFCGEGLALKDGAYPLQGAALPRVHVQTPPPVDAVAEAWPCHIAHPLPRPHLLIP
jgi:hypothetical protein